MPWRPEGHCFKGELCGATCRCLCKVCSPPPAPVDPRDEKIRELERKAALLDEWIAAAQSAPYPPGFGRLLQEPTPARLREAIAQALATEDRLRKELNDAREELRLTIRAQDPFGI